MPHQEIDRLNKSKLSCGQASFLERVGGMSRYISLDIETTGLDPGVDQVLEVGMILDDLQNPKPLAELPKFHCYIKSSRIMGNPVALTMNALIIAKLAHPENYKEDLFLPPTDFTIHVRDWLCQNGFQLEEKTGRLAGKVVIAGKNAASFDIPFLRAMTTTKFAFANYGTDEFMHYIHPAHRVIDPAMFYMKVDD
jgi:DNA polymerase III epsilon subunit-like protein